MQSTGHTSTQDRSFRPMQGSAMMYGMRGPRLSLRPVTGPNRKHRLGPHPVKCAARCGMSNKHHHESPWEHNSDHPLALLGCGRRATRGYVVGMLVRIVGLHYIETARQYVVAFVPLTPDRRAVVPVVRGVHPFGAGAGARLAPWFVPLTLEFAARAVRDPLLRRRLAVVLREAPVGGTSEGLLLRALARLLATPPAAP